MSEFHPTRVLSQLVAVTLPAFLLGLAYSRLTGVQTENAQRQLDNAGQLLNGEVLDEPVTRAIQKRMKTNPRVVILGNSFANTNIHLSALSSPMGLKTSDIARLSIPNTIGSHWYALLKYQVFIEPYEPPDLVIITTDLQSALLNVPLSQGSHQNLLSLAQPGDPILDAKVGPANYWWATVNDNRELVRRNAVLAVRDAAARPFLGGVAEKKVRLRTNQAMDRVFHASLMDPIQRRAILPGTADNEATRLDIDGLQEPESSFLPAIAQLCYEHGARLVLARNHESPAMPPGRGDQIPAGTKAKVRAAIDPYAGLLIDLHSLPMIRDTFENLDHMTDEGAKRFSRTLGGALHRMGALDDISHLVRPPAPSQSPEAITTGPAATLAAHRDTWVVTEPGVPAVWTFEDPWPARPDTFRVQIVLETLGEETPTVTVANEPLSLTSLGGHRWIGDRRGPAPGGPFTLEVTSPDPAVIQSLTVGTGPAPRRLAGDRFDQLGPRVSLLGPPDLYDGELARTPVPVHARNPPPPMPPRKMSRAPNRGASFDARGIRLFSDFETRKHTPLFARCSPSRVLEDGVPLSKPNVGCTEVRDLGEGRMCQSDKKVVFSSSDGTDPLTNGREYTLVLDPGRSCDGGVWLYPRDTVELVVPADRLADLRDGATQLRLHAEFMSPKARGLHAEVRVNGVSRAKARLPKGERGLQVALEPAIRPDDHVVIALSSEKETFALVTALDVLGPRIPWK